MKKIFLALILCLLALGQSPVKITYKGGGILNRGTIHVIWYGDWSNNMSAVPVVENFFRGYGATDRFKLNTLYADETGKRVTTDFKFGKSVFDSSVAQGTSLPQSSGDLQAGIPLAGPAAIVEAHIVNGDLPRDYSATYQVWFGSNVDYTGGGSSCGCQANHAYYVDATGGKILWAAIRFNSYADTSGSFTTFTGIARGSGKYLNDEPVSMSMIDRGAHELDGTIVDPYIRTGWYSLPGAFYNGVCCTFIGGEPDEPCFQSFQYTGSVNGIPYNVKIGSYYYILHGQQAMFGKTLPCVTSIPNPLLYDGTSTALRGQTRVRGVGRVR